MKKILIISLCILLQNVYSQEQQKDYWYYFQKAKIYFQENNISKAYDCIITSKTMFEDDPNYKNLKMEMDNEQMYYYYHNIVLIKYLEEKVKNVDITKINQLDYTKLTDGIMDESENYPVNSLVQLYYLDSLVKDIKGIKEKILKLEKRLGIRGGK